MKDLFINSIMKNITRYYDYDESKLRIIRYGLVSLYLHLTKVVVTFTAAYFLGIFTSLLKLMFFYSILRLTGFGVHAKKSSHCWIASLITFLLIPFLCEKLVLVLPVKLIIMAVCISFLAIYAPADTEKRPLIHKNKRITYKIITLVVSTMYIVSIFFVTDNIISNCMVFGMLIETFMVLPITYKLFGVSYNNYKNYNKKKGDL